MRRVAIHSVPRSGSTWLGAIFDSHPDVVYKYQPLFSYRFKGKLKPKSSEKDILNFFDDLAETDDDFLDQIEAKKQGIVPEFLKSETPDVIVYKEVRYHHILENLLEKDSGIKIIGLIRNPLATLYSWLKAPKEFRTDKGWKESEEWRFAAKKNLNLPEEFNGYEKWKETAYLFHRLNDIFPDRFYLISYAELLYQTENKVDEMLQFVGLEIGNQTKQFLKSSTKTDSKDSYSVYKKKRADDSWVGKLSESICEHIEKDLANTILSRYLNDKEF